MEVLDVLLNSIQNDITQVELLSNNLANSNTPGYQRTEVFSQFLDDTAIAQTVSTMVQNNSGYKNTDRMLDVAIAGEGYFLLDLDGDPVLTRFGRFHVNTEGFLAHSSGALVQGEQGPIGLTGENIHINKLGEVRENDILVDSIQVVASGDSQLSGNSQLASGNSQLASGNSQLASGNSQLASGNSNPLVNVGNGLYKTENYQPINAQLVAGAINNAGANTSADMIRLMELTRHTQSLQKAVYALDQIRDAGINELGKR